MKIAADASLTRFADKIDVGGISAIFESSFDGGCVLIDHTLELIL